MRSRFHPLLLLCLILVGPAACAEVPGSETDALSSDANLAQVTQRIQQNLQRVRPDLPPAMVRKSPMDGFYEASLPGGQILYFHKDGKRFFAGDLVMIEGSQFVNVTDASRRSSRKDLIDAVDEAGMLVFSPQTDDIKATITIFTDIDCGFCRKQHLEVLELNRLGVAVRYMAYPRSGIDTPSYDKYVAAWCADDSLIAFTQAKMGQALPAARCSNPVAEQYMLGGEIGVTATPAIVYGDGELHMGYMTAQEIAKKLRIL